MYLYKFKWLAWWLKLTTPSQAQFYDQAPTRQMRDRLRKMNLASVIAPFVLFSPLLLFQQAQDNLLILIPMIFLMVLALIALVLNRRGLQGVAALLLIVAMDAAIEAAIVLAHTLSTGWLLSFDLFTIPLAVSAVLLTRRYVWVFWLLHTLLIVGDFYLMPHSSDLTTLIQVWNGPSVAFARPLIVQFGITLLSFLLVSSTDEAIDRADKAEEIVKLQEVRAREKEELEQGIHEILNSVILATKGSIPQHVTLSKENTLWRIGSALETLFMRLRAGKQAESQVNVAANDVERLAEALRQKRQGQRMVTMPLSTSPILTPVLQELQQWKMFDMPSASSALNQQNQQPKKSFNPPMS